MADPTNDQTTSDQTQTPPAVQPQIIKVDVQSGIAAEQRAYAEALQQAKIDQKDETIEGGAYVKDGRWINAEGEPIKAPKGK